nr:AAA family ATPase [Pseudomonas sp.]
MDTSQGLLLKNLVLHGHRKDYRVPFHPGINIIYGDADTGKSSILRLVYYLLGGKEVKLDKEITSSVKYATLELKINGLPYCISRDLFNASRDVDVYSCELTKISTTFPEKYKSSVTKGDEQNKSLSDFLLEALEFPSVRIKQAPTKDSSETARLSFLDLFKFMYLDQDDVGSTHMLNIGNPVLETKNREVFKYIFNVLDSSISELEVDISKKTQEKTQLVSQYSAVSAFLSQTEFKSPLALDEEITNIDAVKNEFKEQLSDLNKRTTSDSELYESLKDALNTINLNIEQQESNRQSNLRNIERFSRLLNDYQNDIERIKAGLSSKEIIGRDLSEQTNCPICETTISIQKISDKFDIPTDSRLKSELTSITRRTKDLKQLISENRVDLETSNSLLAELYAEKSRAREMIDEELKSSISPYLAERDAIISELAQLDERRARAVHSLRVRNTQTAIADQIGRLAGTIENLKIRLEELKKNSPSLDGVIKDLGIDLNDFIKEIKIKNHYGVGIDNRTFFPLVRNTEYRKINSGGLRTIVSIGYLASILSQKLRKDTNIPGLLMIDTVGKFLGKTPESAKESQLETFDDIDGVADPEKYKNLFEALIKTAETFDENNKLCQIILVDNDIPHNVAYEIQGFEIAHYRSNGINGLPTGLIDDWDSVDNKEISSPEIE